MHDIYEVTKKTNNIALLQLSGDIPFSRSVYPICIFLNPEVESQIENAYSFDAYGWGKKIDARFSDVLQKVTLDRYNHSLCSHEFGTPLISSQICAGASVGAVCRDDDGGPLTKSVLVNGLQRQTQIGVISFISFPCQRIAVYTDVTSYVDWIVRNVRGFTDA